MPAQPLITIIVAVINNVNGIKSCLDSIANQTYAGWELIVMDGGSKDGTIEILKDYNNTITYWESAPDRGLYHAWNKAIQHAHGDWLYFLGADDFLWDRAVLEHFAYHLDNVAPVIRIAYGRVYVIAKNGELLKVIGEPWENAKIKLYKFMSIPHQGTMHHRTIFSELGLYNESFYIAGDYELMLRVLKKEEALYISDFIVAGMNYGGISTKRSNTVKRLKEDLLARKKHGIKLISWYWLKGYFMAYLWNLLVLLLGEKRAEILSMLRKKITGRRSYSAKNNDIAD